MTSKLKLATDKILEIKPYVPGSYAKSDKKPIKLSSNENPMGCSPKVSAAISAEVAKLNRYPEGTSQILRAKIAELNGVDENRVICGAGSDQLITLICMAFGGPDAEVIYTSHGFLMYPIAALSVGSTPVVAEEKNLKADVDAILNKVNDKTSIVFLANPNNPTGSYLSDREIWKLAKGLPKNVLLVLDMAYAEYATAEDYTMPYKIIDEFENIIMLRTFSKAYGIPGLRLGWGYSTAGIIDILNRIREPFNISSMAQAAGVAALEDQDFVKRSVAHNSTWLRVLNEAFDDMGLVVYPSQANFILVDFMENSRAAAADEFLRAEGISGRRMDAYNLPSCIRFTVGLEEENQALLDTVRKYMNQVI